MLDPIAIQVIRNGLKAAAEEMQISLIKTAHNPLIYEVQDFGVALLNAQGELLAEGSGLPGFLGCLPPSVMSGLSMLGPDGFSEGDVLLVNDPYETGTHISDTVVYVPIFYEGRLTAFSAVMAHWADIGGATPGGWCPDTTDVHQEGMLFAHDKLYEAGVLNRGLLRFVLTNVRFPDLVEGDLNAMIAACRTGANRYQRLCQRYGPTIVRDAMATIFDQSERLMRRKIAEIPAGRYEAEDMMDHDGIQLDRRLRLKCAVTVAGESMHIDWAGSDEVAAGPVNNPFVGTVALCQTVLKALTMPFDPMNHGHMRPLTVSAPEHTIVHPQYPAPCDSYGLVAEMVLHLVIKALSQAIPERCPACSYQMFGIYCFRTEPRHGQPFIYIDPLSGGGGALPHDDGPSGLIFVGNGDAPNTPCEIIETRYPLRVNRYTFNLEGAGAGQYRGGFGVIRDLEMLEDNVLIQVMNENTHDRPWGLHGGESAGVSQVIVWEGTPREQVLTERVAYFGPLHTGDRISVRSTGGGGWGDPAKRDPARIKQDEINGFVRSHEEQ